MHSRDMSINKPASFIDIHSCLLCPSIMFNSCFQPPFYMSFIQAAMDTFPCRANSLVLWHPPRRSALQTGPGPSVPVNFAKRPVQLLVLWGENRVKVKEKGSNFAPSFEGKTDSWGEHYYAQDHDHRWVVTEKTGGKDTAVCWQRCYEGPRSC